MGTAVAAILLIVLLVTGGYSVYYAFSQRNASGVANSGFSLTLTTSTSRLDIPPGAVLVVIPAGVNSDPQLSFEPRDITLVLGVNSSIFFYNEDTKEHIVQSLVWPTNSSGFNIWLIQGQTATLKLNVTGLYQYNFELQPAARNGTIVVLAP